MTQPITRNLILNSPVARAFVVLGDRWKLLILRDAFLVLRRFEDLRRRTGAARGTLTTRLNALVDDEILQRVQYSSSPERWEYRLTEKGIDLYPLALTIWAWETRWSHEDYALPHSLRHAVCGETTTPVLECDHCHGDITVRTTRFTVNGTPADWPEPVEQPNRRSRTRGDAREGVDTTFFHMADIIGDCWSGMVLSAAFFRLRRYDEIAEAIGISTNILADRLRKLVASGILEKRRYRERPARYEYRLTDKGRDLYPTTIAMHNWAERWLIYGDAPLTIFHDACGESLKTRVVCSECAKPLVAGEVVVEDHGSVGQAAAAAR